MCSAQRIVGDVGDVGVCNCPAQRVVEDFGGAHEMAMLEEVRILGGGRHVSRKATDVVAHHKAMALHECGQGAGVESRHSVLAHLARVLTKLRGAVRPPAGCGNRAARRLARAVVCNLPLTVALLNGLLVSECEPKVGCFLSSPHTVDLTESGLDSLQWQVDLDALP